MSLTSQVTPTEGSTPLAQSLIAEARAGSDQTATRDSMHVTLLAGGVALLLLLPLAYTLFRCRRRNHAVYEDIPESSLARKRASRCSQASIYSANQSRPIDFVLPSIPPAFQALASPGAAETTSLSSSDSSEIPLWARLALLEPGPTLLGGLNPELYRIKNLPSRVYGCNNCCDPFVRIYVLPDERRYIQSKMKKKTCNPKFEENFIFQMPSKNAEDRIVKATVLDSDRGKRYNVIGHALFPLKEIDLTTNEMCVQWKDLIKDVDTVVPCDAGELLVSLCYNENLERLTVTVCEAKGLKIPEGQQTLDSFVKLIFMIENKQMKSKKTVPVKKSTDPKYNESFHFRLPQKCLNSASILLQVTVSGGPNKDKIIGRVVFGSYMFVRGKPLEHWNEAISAGHKQIRHWQKLTL
ncbi:Synaptotagmin-15 like protein [Argiope bruennichi]|uniref:Synaptotagmin-15 like protein n=1 Tax=Argiope bruennichi TaxID=94029 RepID=A0A8T0G588_ARGBR|nr:Synaptotagmin-15 like protein [Argiope bruennichi]